ncbi:MAG: glycosyltransferase family 39 protein [Gemmatimonadota bacterium]|nr:glycosyltransferase family 39 protein [Gemmatimonadota bacterium]
MTAAVLPSTWRGLTMAAAYAILAAAGQAASLRLIEAGAAVRYQHYRLDRLEAEGAAAAAVIVVQLFVVAVGMRPLWPRLRAWLGHTFGWWRMVLLGLAVALTSAAVSRDVATLGAELLLATLVQLAAAGTVVLAVRAMPDGPLVRARARLNRLLGEPAPATRGEGDADLRPGTVDRFALLAALWVVAASAVLAVVSYQRHPHIPDEVSYLIQARYLAEGMLAMPAPPVPAAFNIDLMQYEPARWFSPFPPGWPALLALGVAAGVPWLVNPILGGIIVLLAYGFLRELYPRRTARIGVLLLCVSPWHLFMAMSIMSHTFSLCATMAAALAVARLRRTQRLPWALVGGIAIGLVTLMRPLEGVVIAALLGLWIIAGGGRRPRIIPAATLALGAALVGVANIPYNRGLTGSPTRFPVMAYFDAYYGPGVNDLGFGANRGVGWALDPFPGHGARDVVVNTQLNAFAVNIELLGWATGSVLLIAMLVLGGRLRRPDWLMLVAIAGIVGVHALYWFNGGPDFGARYWYLILVPCIALTARGLEWLEVQVAAWYPPAPEIIDHAVAWGPPPNIDYAPDAGSDRHRSDARAIAPVRALAAAALLSLCALLTFLPWRAIDKYHRYRGMRPDVRHLAERHGFGRSLVLVQGRRFPDYASAAAYNPPDVRNPDAPVYAWDRTPQVRAELLAAYPDRPVWVVKGPSATDVGYRVVAGPLAPNEVATRAPAADPRFDRGGSNTEGVVRPSATPSSPPRGKGRSQ